MNNKFYASSPYQCLRLSRISSMTTGWLQFNVFPEDKHLQMRELYMDKSVRIES